MVRLIFCVLYVVILALAISCTAGAPPARCETCDQSELDNYNYTVQYGQQEYPGAELQGGGCHQTFRQYVCELQLALAPNAVVFVECRWSVSVVFGEYVYDFQACTSEVHAPSVRCETCGPDSSEWLDPASPEAQPYIAAIISIDPTLSGGQTSCRTSQEITGCCVVHGPSLTGICYAVVGGVFVAELVSGDYYWLWLWII